MRRLVASEGNQVNDARRNPKAIMKKNHELLAWLNKEVMMRLWNPQEWQSIGKDPQETHGTGQLQYQAAM